jgi:hypothetical protein
VFVPSTDVPFPGSDDGSCHRNVRKAVFFPLTSEEVPLCDDFVPQFDVAGLEGFVSNGSGQRGHSAVLEKKFPKSLWRNPSSNVAGSWRLLSVRSGAINGQ